jgi:hypothetical protein
LSFKSGIEPISESGKPSSKVLKLSNRSGVNLSGVGSGVGSLGKSMVFERILLSQIVNNVPLEFLHHK